MPVRPAGEVSARGGTTTAGPGTPLRLTGTQPASPRSPYAPGATGTRPASTDTAAAPCPSRGRPPPLPRMPTSRSHHRRPRHPLRAAVRTLLGRRRDPLRQPAGPGRVRRRAAPARRTALPPLRNAPGPVRDRYDRWVLLEPGTALPWHLIPLGHRWTLAGDGKAVNLGTRRLPGGVRCRFPHALVCPCDEQPEVLRPFFTALWEEDEHRYRSHRPPGIDDFPGTDPLAYG
ncbi:DUF6083 domain-containing protein [Streptomyces albus]